MNIILITNDLTTIATFYNANFNPFKIGDVIILEPDMTEVKITKESKDSLISALNNKWNEMEEEYKNINS